MDGKCLVPLALNAMGGTQKELALKLGVSAAQITKWKNGEYMSTDMEAKLRDIAGIGDLDPVFVHMAGSTEDALKWSKLLHWHAVRAEEESESGFDTYFFDDECPMNLERGTFCTLKLMGIDIPKPFPPALDFDYERQQVDENEMADWDILLEENELSSLIHDLYISLTDVYGFYAAFLDEVIDELHPDLYQTVAINIEPCLMELAATKIDPVPQLATNFAKFKQEVQRDYVEWLNIVKEHAFKAGIPLRAEPLKLVLDSHESLGAEADDESLGLNEMKIHPDIYINELLVGMRTILRVLPAILEKLGLEEEAKSIPPRS